MLLCLGRLGWGRLESLGLCEGGVVGEYVYGGDGAVVAVVEEAKGEGSGGKGLRDGRDRIHRRRFVSQAARTRGSGDRAGTRRVQGGRAARPRGQAGEEGQIDLLARQALEQRLEPFVAARASRKVASVWADMNGPVSGNVADVIFSGARR